MSTANLLGTFLDASVWLRIQEYRRAGGPSAADFDRVRAFASRLAAKGDALMYRVPGETAEMANGLADAIATLAFMPGGITFLGRHFEASPPAVSTPGTADR